MAKKALAVLRGERICPRCGVVMVVVMPGGPERWWFCPTEDCPVMSVNDDGKVEYV